MPAATTLRSLGLAVGLGLYAAAFAGALPTRPVSLEPGVAVVEGRDRKTLRLRLDRGAKAYPAQLQGVTVVIRRLVRKVHVPQAWRPFAEEWQENGAATVLPIHETGGDFVAELVWEDEKTPVQPGDRVELCRVPDAALSPLISAIRCVGRGGEPVVAPGEMVWVEADVLSPTGFPPDCEWACEAGQFLLPGGLPAGEKLRGPLAVRWRAPAPAPKGATTTIRLKASAGPRGEPAEAALALRIGVPASAYTRVQWTRTLVPGLKKDDPGPLFQEARLLAGGPRDSFYLVDAPNRRLLHWQGGVPRYAALGRAEPIALCAIGQSAYVVQEGALVCLKPQASELTKAGPLPDVKRLAGLGADAAGDLYVLDSGAPPGLHYRVGGSWQSAPMEPRVDSPWLKALAVAPDSNDAYVLDTRDRVIRHWRALQSGQYRLLEEAIAVGKAIDAYGEPVALMVRTDRVPRRDLPVQLVFKDGRLTDKWQPKGKPPRWEPEMAAPARQLVLMRFAAQGAALLPSGDVLLAGEAGASGSKGARVVQVSARGDFRRMLPLPQMPPRFLAAAPDGRRYVVVARRVGRRGGERLIVVGPEGWMIQDLGLLDAYRYVYGLRADRGSSSHVLLIADRQRRESVFRIDATDPSRTLELSSAGLPGPKIPDHEAVDAASSARRIVVLDREGKVLVFANGKPIRYQAKLETGLRKPKAIAILADPDGDGGQRAFICVLSSERTPALHLWEVRTADAGKQVLERIGTFPDPERSTPAMKLSETVAIGSAFPDQSGLLYVLDRGGTQVRVFDVPAIARKLRQKLPPEIPTKPVLDKLSVGDEGLDLSIGAGQVVHILDEEGHGIQTFARQP